MLTLPANYLHVEQGKLPWFEARMGCVTSSRVAAVKMLTRKSGDKKAGEPTAAYDNLKKELLCERLLSAVPYHYFSKWMEDGRDREPTAKMAYSLKYDVDVRSIGLVLHPEIKMAAASPDGLILADGLMEVKCPKESTHLEYLLGEVIPKEYRPQMMWQLACAADRKWNEFVSFHPDFPESMQLFVRRMHRAEVAEQIAELEASVSKLLSEVDEWYSRLLAVYGTDAAPIEIAQEEGSGLTAYETL